MRRRRYLTRAEARERFRKHSGDDYQKAEYKVDKDAKGVGGADNRERAKFWEIWHKGERRVLWVAHGCETILDEDDPHLDLQNFFPCPKPAYGTCQRGSLVPVPDVMQYRDQLEELNMLTGRIHALSDALEAKGFYPAGGAELSDAMQAAVKASTPGRLLVPISNWAAFGGSKEVIIWLPIDMIAQTITALVALRKQVIEDIYQIMGLSDIMRGATDPQETLGAQQLKTQYGSTRIRDKQQEMVRLARDLVEIATEIITEKFDDGDHHRDEPDATADQRDGAGANGADTAPDVDPATGGAGHDGDAERAATGAAEAGTGAADDATGSADPATGHAGHRQAARAADHRAGAELPQEPAHEVLRARHRDRQHHHGGRARREASAHRVHPDAGRAAARNSPP